MSYIRKILSIFYGSHCNGFWWPGDVCWRKSILFSNTSTTAYNLPYCCLICCQDFGTERNIIILPTTDLNDNTSAKSIQSALNISVEVSELISQFYIFIFTSKTLKIWNSNFKGNCQWIFLGLNRMYASRLVYRRANICTCSYNKILIYHINFLKL